jgi:hypothetical protein
MRLYRVFLCFVFLGLLAGAVYSQTDPTVGLRGDGASTAIVGTTFFGTFPGADTTTPCPTDLSGNTNCLDYSNNNLSSPTTNTTFIALHLYFAPTNPSLTYTCDNSLDPFFTSCSVSADGNEVTFSGLSSTVLLSAAVQNSCPGGDCKGIPSGDVELSHFSLFLESTDKLTFTGVADLAVVTPEPASALLFVIGIGAIALFLKRA